MVPRLYLVGAIADLPAPMVGRLARIARKFRVPFAVQLRDKPATDRTLYLHALRLSPLADLYVNGRPHVALAAGARGVHLGPSTLPPSIVRKRFPALEIGYSAHNARELRDAEGADFVLLSPFARPVSKAVDTRKPLGPGRFGRLAAKSPVPALALGGLVPGNAQAALDAGAAGIATSGAVLAARDPVAAFRRLARLLRRT